MQDATDTDSAESIEKDGRVWRVICAPTPTLTPEARQARILAALPTKGRAAAYDSRRVWRLRLGARAVSS